MTFSKNDAIYCDANFLVAYGAREVKQLDLKKRAIVLFAKILSSKCKFVASSLTFDETWLGIRRELGPKSTKKKMPIRLTQKTFTEPARIWVWKRGIMKGISWISSPHSPARRYANNIS